MKASVACVILLGALVAIDCRRTSYGRSGAKAAVWNAATPIHGRDPALYRADPSGHTIYAHSYGKKI